ncbi:MAG TPA: lipopolysaccharide heptosyltransferase II [Gemmatimonadales bacterium]|nr:lipopolysaccharide heptosyltransferase II [Gemmatimonadales bacterium]
MTAPLPLPALVIQTAFLGDVVLTTPLLVVLAERHGPVDVVTTPAAAPLLATHPAVRRVFPYDKRQADRGFAGLRGLARRLRAERYAVAYLPHRSLRSAALARLARIPRRVGYADGWRSLYTETRPRPRHGHEIDRLLALVEGTSPQGVRPTLQLVASDVARAEAELRAASVAPPFATVAPGSIWGSKRWPYFAALARRLAQRVDVVLLGGPDDAALAEAIVAAAATGAGAHRVVSLCGRLSLRESAAVIREATVLVTNDSAPLHFAQAVETPTVAIFGPTIPAFGFGPRGPRDIVVGLDGLACRPCSPHGPAACPLGHHRCLQGVSVDDVLRAMEETGALHHRD